MEVGQTRLEIERLLDKHAADQVLIGSDKTKGQGFVGFTLERRQYRVMVPARAATGRQKQEQLDRERWRALLPILKVKLEVVASGIVTAEQEFLAYLVMTDGRTVGAAMAPEIEQMYLHGTMPRLLPEGT